MMEETLSCTGMCILGIKRQTVNRFLCTKSADISLCFRNKEGEGRSVMDASV